MLHYRDIKGNTPSSQNRVLPTLNVVTVLSLPSFNKLKKIDINI